MSQSRLWFYSYMYNVEKSPSEYSIYSLPCLLYTRKICNWNNGYSGMRRKDTVYTKHELHELNVPPHRSKTKNK